MEKNKKSKKNHRVSLLDESYTVSLPEELMVEILLRLPVRSVVRFKCVCKSWLSLICSPKFAQLHFDLAAAPSHRFLFSVTSNGSMESIDPEASLRDVSAVMYLRLPPLPAPLYYDRNSNLVSDRLQVCGSCRGFILLHQYMRSGLIFIVWNPLTGVHKPIPPDSSVNERASFLCGFCYDASNDDYLVIYIKFIYASSRRSKPKAMIKLFSLKSNTWDCKYVKTKRRYSHCNGYDIGFDFRAGSLLNGALHWLVSANNNKDKVIIVFDLVERSLSEIPPPPPPHVLNRSKGLRVIGGCLCVWMEDYNNEGRRGALWMMKEYKVLSSWTRSFDLCGGPPFHMFSPICLTKDNMLFGSDPSRQILLKLCGKTNKWLRESLYYHEGQNYCNLQCSLFRESLLSLPNVSGNNPRGPRIFRAYISGNSFK